MATLKERDPEEYAALRAFYTAAVEKISDPDFERVQPPPRRTKRLLPLLMLGA